MSIMTSKLKGIEMKNLIVVLAAGLALSACASEPVVSSFNGDSVSIIEPALASLSDEVLLSKANEICSRGNKKKFAEVVSKRKLQDLEGTEYLFLCLLKA